MPFSRFTLRASSAIAVAVAALTVPVALAPQQAAAQEAAPQVPSTVSGRIPVAEFVKQSNMSNARISPDGRHLAYFTGQNGRQVLVMLDLQNLTQPPKLILASEEAREAGDRTMTGFRWIGSKHVVMTVISRENLGGNLSDFRRLIAYDIDSGKLVQQAWRDAGADAGRILYVNDDTGKYLLQRDSVANSTERWGFPEVVEVDVSDGSYTMVQRTNPVVRAWAADGKGVVRAGFNSSGESGKLRMLYRTDDSGNFRTVYNEADESFTATVPIPQMFVPGTDEAYVMSRDEGFDRVYRVNMNTLKLGKPVFEVEGFDVQGIITNDDDTQVVGYRTFDGTLRNIYTDPTLKAVNEALEEVFGEGEVILVDFTKDFSKFILVGGGVKREGGYYIYDTKTGALQLLNWTRSAIKDAPLNPVRAEWYTASDGTKIQAIVTYPRHRLGQKNLPVVVLPHGGPFGALSATNATEPWNQPLAEQGYVVIQPNYRGSGGYGRKFEDIGREPGGYGKRMQDDLNDILTYFGQQGTIDPNRACIMGWSYGGYAAARGAQRDAKIWKCAIAGAGVYDMPLMNRWDSRNLGRFNSGFQATSEDPEGISSARNTDGPWAPILIVTAKRDARIPMEQAETLVSNLQRSGKVEGKDFRYIVQEKGTHQLPYDDVHIQWIEEAYNWLQKYNPAYIPADGDQPPKLITFN